MTTMAELADKYARQAKHAPGGEAKAEYEGWRRTASVCPRCGPRTRREGAGGARIYECAHGRTQVAAQ